MSHRVFEGLSAPLSQTAQVFFGSNYSSTQHLTAFDIFARPKSIYLDTRIFPAYITGASILLLVLQLLWHSSPIKKLYVKPTSSEGPEEIPAAGMDAQPLRTEGRVARLGGPVILGFNVVRLLSCLALLGLSIGTAYATAKKEESSGPSQSALLLQVVLCGVHAYASILALISVIATPAVNVTRHITVILLTVWAVFAYRNLWPFATVSLSPMDAAEGPLLWAKLAVLTIAAVIVPLFIPRPYSPVDPKNPWSDPHPEQTASIISIMMFAWLEPTVWKASTIAHLPVEQLPPLADYDDASHLIKTTFDELDPFKVKKKGRHIVWGLLYIFRRDFIIMGAMLMLQGTVRFASPIAIKNLLLYLENGGKGTIVRPGLWISFLFLSPLMDAVFISLYFFFSSRLLVHVEAIITQLVFDHALRMRMKAEVPDASTSGSATATTTPDSASVAESSGTRTAEESAENSGDEDTTLAGSSTTGGNANSESGKQKAKTASDGDNAKVDLGKDKGKKEDAAPEKGKNVVGKINNLITSDLETLAMGKDIMQLVVQVPFHMVLCVWFLYSILGWSAFAGMGTIIVLLPLPGKIATMLRGYQIEKMKKTDARVQSVTESMNVIRMIKLFGWEHRINGQLKDKREVEINWIRKTRLMQLTNGLLNHIIPLITMVATFLTYTIIMKKQLTASKVFSAMTVFDMFSMQMHMIFGMIPQFIRAKVSLDRVNDFLQKTELLDEFSEKHDDISSELVLSGGNGQGDVIGFRNAAFTWSNEQAIPSTPGSSRRTFTLRIEGELYFKRNCVNLIVGPTGSGKTSLLMALLGEMHYIPSGPDSFFNLPRNGGVAYAAQESWVQNETIRDNILFGSPYDEDRYNKVIHQCGLKRDLDLFDAGDKTEVGEKGITLSGGQKARVTLARAVYSTAEILLLDDILAALDVHTARWIIEQCLKGDLVRGRTVLLVTHNVMMASPIAQFVIGMGTDGRVSSQGSLSSALEHDKKLAAEVAEQLEDIKKAEDVVDEQEPEEIKKSDGKLVVEEEISEGHLGWPALRLYFGSVGGKHGTLFWATLLTITVVSEFTDNLQIWYIGYWARQYEERPAEDVSAPYYLSMYAFIMVLSVIFYGVFSVFLLLGTLRGSKSLHNSLVSSVLGTTLRWLDKTPTSRIIARCTQDISSIDNEVARYLEFLISLTAAMLLKLGAIILTSPLFAIPGMFLAAAGGSLGQLYMRAQLCVKREKSNAKAPVLGHFGAAFAGLVSIRAYGAQDAFRRESYTRINRYTRVARIFWNLNRWVSIRIEMLTATFTTSLAVYLVYATDKSASTIGFSLNMAVGFGSMILWLVRIFNEFEVAGNSLERIQQYLEIEQEPKPTESGIPPAYWPASGNLKVEKLSARYSPDGPAVLHDISFEIKSGERVGIVGRTGSGKSSLTLALLRCIVTEGKVYYDGVPTDSVNLDALRSNITIIPQMPELLSGTLRQNLDPFEEFDDAVLNDALRSAGLFSLQSEMDEGRITLDTEIAGGGANLSVGQKQILALARAMVRQSKLLILDEATSAIDYATDTIIQESLRRELDKGVTLLTIAHRLQTIIDADKIMVLDAGRIVEFGKPSELLEIENGMFRALVDESGDKDALHAAANGAGRLA